MNSLINYVKNNKLGSTVIVGSIYFCGNYLIKNYIKPYFINKKAKGYDKEESNNKEKKENSINILNNEYGKNYIQNYLIAELKINEIKKEIINQVNKERLFTIWNSLKNSILIYYISDIILNKFVYIISITNYYVINIVNKNLLINFYYNKLAINEILSEIFDLTKKSIINIYSNINTIILDKINNLSIKDNYTYTSLNKLLFDLVYEINENINYIKFIHNNLEELLIKNKYSDFYNNSLKDNKTELKIKFYELFHNIILNGFFYDSLIDEINKELTNQNSNLLKTCFNNEAPKNKSFAQIITFIDNSLFNDNNNTNNIPENNEFNIYKNILSSIDI